MAGSGLYGHGSSFTLSPLAPPLPIGQTAPDGNLSWQVTSPLGEFMNYSSSEVAGNWPPACPFTARNDHLMPSSFALNFPSLGYDHVFPYSRSMATASVPVSDAIPYDPFFSGITSDTSVPIPYDPFSSGIASDTSVPLCPNSLYPMYGKQFEGNVPSSEHGGSQGLRLTKGNLSILHGKSDSMTTKNKMELTPCDDGFLSLTKSDVSPFDVPRMEVKGDDDELDGCLRSYLPYNNGSSFYRIPQSREIYSRCLETTSLSSSSFPRVSMEESGALKPNTSSHATYHQPGFHSVGPAVTNTKSFESYDAKTIQKQTTSYSCDVQDSTVFPGLNVSDDDEQKSGVQILNIGNKDFVADNVGKKEMLFNFLKENLSGGQNVDDLSLNQSSIPNDSYGSGLPVQSAFEVSNQLDHAVDSMCWKQAYFPSSFSATVKTSMEQSAVSLEATSTPSRSLFPTCATTQLNHIDSKSTHEDISKKVVEDLNSNICMEFPVVLPCPARPDIANCDTKAACSPSNSQTNTDTFRLSGYPGKSECFDSYGCSVPLPQLKADDVVNIIFYLSKLLSTKLSDLSALKDKDHESLQLTIKNLTACLSTRKMDEHCCLNAWNKIADSFELVDEKNDPHSRPRIKKNPCSCQACKHRKFCSKDNFSEIGALACKGFETSSRTSSEPSEVDEKHFGETAFNMEENHRQTLVYKKLWIESEAALCSLKYQLMCAQMQLEVEKGSHDPIKDSKVDAMGNPVLQEDTLTSDSLKLFEAELQKRCAARQEISVCNDVLRNNSNSENTSKVGHIPIIPVIDRFMDHQNQVKGFKESIAQDSNSSDRVSYKSSTSGFHKAHSVEIENQSKKMVGISPIAPVIGRFRVSQTQIDGTSDRTLFGSSSSSDSVCNKSNDSILDKAHNMDSKNMVVDDISMVSVRGCFSVCTNHMEGSLNETFVETSRSDNIYHKSYSSRVFEDNTKCSTDKTSVPSSTISVSISQRSNDPGFSIAHNIELQGHSNKMVDLSPLVLNGRFRVDDNGIDDSSNIPHVCNSIISESIISQRSNDPGFDKAHEKIKDDSKRMLDLNHKDSVMARFRILQNLVEGSSNITPGENSYMSVKAGN